MGKERRESSLPGFGAEIREATSVVSRAWQSQVSAVGTTAGRPEFREARSTATMSGSAHSCLCVRKARMRSHSLPALHGAFHCWAVFFQSERWKLISPLVGGEHQRRRRCLSACRPRSQTGLTLPGLSSPISSPELKAQFRCRRLVNWTVRARE